MEHVISKLVHEFEQGRLNRRQLIQSLAVAATASAAAAAESDALKASGIHHISYQVKDYARTRDFYSSLLGVKVANDTGKQCFLVLGDTEIVARNGGGTTPLVDHIAYTIDPWKSDAILAELKRRGVDPQPEGQNSFQFKDPDGFHVQLIAKS